MSLAARCPACGTVFRVVHDQLRVSEGWVRCGRCAEVFNAIENLVDLEADVAGLPSTRSPSRDRGMEELARVSRFPDEDVAEAAKVAEVAEAGASRLEALQVKSEAVFEHAPETAPPAAPAFQPEPAPDALRAEPGWRTEPAYSPTFIRRAERAARWRRPGVRAGLAVLAAVGSIGLATQAVFEYRDWVAARWPLTRPWLAQACAAAGCRIEAPRAIEALAVESSGLVRIERTPMYRLSVVLRNRAALALALPALDLTLTDAQGGVIARRVLMAAELGTRQPSLPAGAEMPLQTTLSAGERPISGYTIEIFYP